MKLTIFFIFLHISIIFSIDNEKNHNELIGKALELINTNDCTIPSFIIILPIFYLRRFKKIWTLSNNDKLEDCKSIWKETKEFVYQLPRVLQNRFINFIDKEESDKTNANFILELLPEEKEFFEKTLNNVSMTMEEKVEILSVWGNERLSTSAMGHFNKFLEAIVQKDKKLKEKIDNLSPEAKKAYKQIIELQRLKQNMFESFSSSVKKELANIWKNDIIIKSKNFELEREMLTLDGIIF
ncbi:Hypothetical protein SRAE_2000172100 [Strongyloides ratti]|uniref:Nematode fatty acid retinoid binding family-containing protein n=1 Tax=Strongyloides ratti TaxID=34506 RepID=A0A090LBA3_STRRB|nr:Hypothetical protein SRAE_2000172100 [Strongyloides ratti]CEF67056.1 Hypothetical protein SRAE_2000172100 [Strongyloides ratti]